MLHIAADVVGGLLFGFHAFGPNDELVTLAFAHILGEDEESW